MNITRDIQTLTHFKRETSRFLGQLKETGQPVVLTVNGKAELVVQDAKSYQQLMDWVERLETIEAVQKGLAQKQAGLGRPSNAAFDGIRKVNRKRSRVVGIST